MVGRTLCNCKNMNNITNRDDLGKLFQEYNSTGVGVEVGCHLGDFSKTLSKDWKGKIISIDHFDEKDFMYIANMYERAVENLKDTNCEVRKGTSSEVAKTIEDGSLDWVYIDANHKYEAIKEDIELWFPKVRKGGVVSGHDYLKDYSVHNIEFGVWKAVDEFCKQHEYKFELIHDTISGADFASWYFIK